jgi:hypothetical protein
MAAMGRLKVTLKDSDPFVVDIGPVVMVAAERHFGKSFAQLGDVNADGRFENIFWIAWKATHFSGRVVEPFDEWIAKLESVTDDTEAPSAPLGEA